MNTEVINVKGMTCGGCSAAITRALEATPGVRNVTVDLPGSAVTVHYDESAATLAALKSAIEGAGYEVAEDRAPRKRGGGCCCG